MQRIRTQVSSLSLKPKKDIHETHDELENLTNEGKILMFDLTGPTKKDFKERLWTSIIISWWKPELELFEKRLSTYLNGEFHYIPEIRYDISRKLFIDSEVFNDLLRYSVERDRRSGRGRFTIRMRRPLMDEHSHRPLILDNLQYSLLKGERHNP